MYNSFQIIWHDNVGEHLFVSSYANAFNSAMTLAIALQNTQSATHIEIVECGSNDSPTGDRGIWYKKVFIWDKS